MKNLLFLIGSFVALVFSISCAEESPNDFASNGPVFNLDLFEQNLIEKIDFVNSPIGWAYTISINGTLERFDDFGDARLPADGELGFTIDKEINIASITKFYTAIAAMQLLDANELTIDDEIAEWLPKSWRQGPGVSSITFKELLMHESGLESINSSFDSTLTYSGLQTCIQTGVINSKSRNYLNVNFALFRVLIPSLWSALPDPPAIDIENDANTQFMYLLYMQENIFDRVGLSSVGCMPESDDIATLYYNVNDELNGANGVQYDDWNPMCGGGGYYMSTREMAAVNAYFEHTEELLSDELKDELKEFRLGLDLASSEEMYGTYYGKGGSISNGISQGVRGHVAIFPYNGVDCAVIMNTQGMTFDDDSGNNSLSRSIYQAYNDAWENP